MISVARFGAVGDDNYRRDSASQIQAAVDSLGRAGGAVYFPPGVYWCASPIQLPSNVMLLGEGPYVSILRNRTTGLFHIPENAHYVQLRQLGLHVCVPAVAHVVTACGAVGGWVIADCDLVQQSDVRSIWYQADGGATNLVVERCRWTHTLTAKVPTWHMRTVANCCTWRDSIALYSGAYSLMFDSYATDAYIYGVSIERINWEVCNGGLVHARGVHGLRVRDCSSGDFQGPVSKDLYLIESSGGGLDSKCCVIDSCNRYGGVLAEGVADVRVLGRSEGHHRVSNNWAAGGSPYTEAL